MRCVEWRYLVSGRTYGSIPGVLKGGDFLTEPIGGGPVDLTSIMTRIQAGEEITVARRNDDDVWVDTVLPAEEGEASP